LLRSSETNDPWWPSPETSISILAGENCHCPKRLSPGHRHSHLNGKDDGSVAVARLSKIAGRWRRLFTSPPIKKEIEAFRRRKLIDRVFGDEVFQKRLE